MTREQFYNAVDNPDSITPDVVDSLAQMVRHFPYFHAGWMLFAKGLHDSGSAHFSAELKKASIHVWDRGALFWLVNGRDENGAPVRKPRPSEESQPQQLPPAKPATAVAPQSQQSESLQSADVNQSDAEATHVADAPSQSPLPQRPETLPSAPPAEPRPKTKVLSPVSPVTPDYFSGVSDELDGLDLGSPAQPTSTYELSYSDDHLRRPAERYTFADWLDYVSERSNIKEEEAQQDRHTKQNRLIDKFLEEPVERIQASPSRSITQSDAKRIEEQSVSENDDILTETLASIYLKQKQFDRAVNIFKKLSLKYPEKSSYFASRIADIQKQQSSKI